LDLPARDEEWRELRPVLWLPRDAVAGRTMDKVRKSTTHLAMLLRELQGNESSRFFMLLLS